MPSGGDTYNKYGAKRRADGRLCLDNGVHDAAVKLLAEGEDKKDIPALLEDQITEGEIDTLLDDPIAQRRLAFLKRDLEESKAPSSFDEYKEFALKKLYKLAADGKTEDKNKISACKTLGELAHQFSKDKTSPSAPQHTSAAVQRLVELNASQQASTAAGS